MLVYLLMSELHHYFIKNLREMTSILFMLTTAASIQCVSSVPTDEWSTRLFYLSCTCLTTAPETITIKTVPILMTNQYDHVMICCLSWPMTIQWPLPLNQCTTRACTHIQSTTDCTYWTWPTNTTMIIIMIYVLQWPSNDHCPCTSVPHVHAHTSHPQQIVPTELDQPIRPW